MVAYGEKNQAFYLMNPPFNKDFQNYPEFNEKRYQALVESCGSNVISAIERLPKQILEIDSRSRVEITATVLHFKKKNPSKTEQFIIV